MSPKFFENTMKLNETNMSNNSTALQQIYEEVEKKKILEGDWLTDISVYKFHEILRRFSSFQPRDTLLVINHLENRNAARIKPIPQNEKHLQVIHSRDHWICIFFDLKNIFVYNYIYRNFLTRDEKAMVRALFPYLQILPLQFPRVQQQSDFINCALYAMAFATSIVFQEDPVKIVYDNQGQAMRKHFLKIWSDNRLIRFPEIDNANKFYNIHDSFFGSGQNNQTQFSFECQADNSGETNQLAEKSEKNNNDMKNSILKISGKRKKKTVYSKSKKLRKINKKIYKNTNELKDLACQNNENEVYFSSDINQNPPIILRIYKNSQAEYKSTFVNESNPENRKLNIANEQQSTKSLHQNQLVHNMNDNWVLRKLPNNDSVSCYANSAVQSIFHCFMIRHKLMESVDCDIMKDFLDIYISDNIDTDIYNLRCRVPGDYWQNEQQDVSEFITDLCHISEIFQSTVFFLI